MSACAECFVNDGNHKLDCSRRTAVTVDWNTVRSSGIANVVYQQTGSLEAATFDAPMISHIEGNLWMGGCKGGLRLDDDFVKVVSLYPWEQYDLGPNTKRVEVKMYDSHDGVDFDDLAKAVNSVEWGLENGKTLVHCQAGLNRSGLVAAYTLMRRGYKAREAIDLLREKRSPLVLCNQTFVEQLHALEKIGGILNEL